ncbi:histidine phosphatase family protein [Saccharomonospora saliphila]|uniref:histidine phosphatase family protein n=1 Tax=Saccharomonospora saliphila TaxID=369829 RepID=UPI0003630B5F|nr:histidine phosphatase family protein [Saccharomonospora saliphila]
MIAGAHEHPLFLLRHGHTEWSATGRHAGRTDLPLTAVGERQAHAAGRSYALMSDDASAVVLSSPLRRALHTAELAGLEVSEVTEDLVEWDYGDYEGLTTPEIREHVPGWSVWTHPMPGGESPDAVRVRADRVLGHVRPLLAEQPVVLVGHDDFGRVLIARWLELDPAAGRFFRSDPASLTVLGRQRGVPQIRHLNVPPS